MRFCRCLAGIIIFLGAIAPARSIVGGATDAPGEIARHVVLIVGSHGISCTGTVIAIDLVLTAAHCVMPEAIYKIVEFDAAGRPSLLDTARVVQHPQFDLKIMLAHRATADVGLLKLAAPLPSRFAPASIDAGATIVAGERFTVAGFGVAVRGDGRTGGTLRSATLVAIGKPGPLQLRLVDPMTRGERGGLSACTGDSGAPVFGGAAGHLAVIGVVSWSTGPNASAGCGGLTGVTPLRRYRDWIIGEASEMGSPLD